ncbi:MAG: NADH-quinone oxidoreductase subunit NuoH [Dehalococcoidia bacterium]|jgi:NADH-quinone oxidoreductase subunit H
MAPFLALSTDHWYDIRDLANLSDAILDGADKILPFGFVYVIAALIGFVASFLIFVLPSQLYVGVYGERKIIGRMQSRYGPNRVGPFGLLQPVADAIKLLTKEALTPTESDRLIMYVAPIIFVMPAVLMFAVIPFGPRMVFANIPVSLLYFMAISSLPVIATFMAGWSANNKYSLFGAMRIVAMAISYEVPLVMALLGAVVVTSGAPFGGSYLNGLALQDMVLWAREFHIWVVFVQPLAMAIYFICVSAELNRTPTDIAEAESEIVAGYLTEYSGMKWGLFYGMDIGYALGASAFAATVFLGGWTFFGLEKWVPPWMIFVGKTHLFYFLFIWTRGTLPRLRSDQLMAFAWKFLLPLSLFNLFVITTERMIWSDQDYAKGLIYLFAAVNIALSVAAVYAWARFLGYNRVETPTRPRLVKNAGGYVPVGSEANR